MWRLVWRYLFVLAFGVLAFGQAKTVRVLLEEATAATVVLHGAHEGTIDGGMRFETPLGLTWAVSVREGALWSGETSVGESLLLTPTDGVPLTWNGGRYRGGLLLRAQGERMQVVNVLGLEDYLRGVVPAEMPPSWPLEALKAQAVAARTYTLAHISAELAPDEPFDICATVECQKYRGVEAEHPRSDRAIRETAGLVLTFENDMAVTYYHSDSGGVLASSAEVWGEDLPYLKARADIESASPHRRWRFELDPEVIAESLRARGLDVGAVTTLTILAYTDSGRASRAEVSGTGGSAVLEGEALRLALRGWGLKSTHIRMRDALTAEGDGWGHGVGMSQYGARSLALSGNGFEEILAFYYPQTKLTPLGSDE